MSDEVPKADGPVVVIAHTVREQAVAGSTKVPCNTCRRMVWLSPASRQYVESQPLGWRVSCLACAQALDPDKGKVLPLTEGQLREMNEADPSLTPERVLPRVDTPERRKDAMREILARDRRQRAARRDLAGLIRIYRRFKEKKKKKAGG